MKAFALYRLPSWTKVMFVEQTHGELATLSSISSLNGCEGFVVAPFHIADSCPLMLIRPDAAGVYDVSMASEIDDICSRLPLTLTFSDGFIANRETYRADFHQFHNRLKAGDFRKLVLARCAVAEGTVSPVALFLKACQCYPEMFVALVYTPQSGLWLMSTPEILLEKGVEQWRTIALAGTMKWDENAQTPATWSAKNTEEQHLVASYIAEKLKPFACNLREEGPRTVRAAQLLHLRSDFTFGLKDEGRIGELLQALHPTPAVCGLPKDEALRFIRAEEHTPRQYYSGFMGPLMLEGSTHLYVALRCMQIFASCSVLYAGGGLLPESEEPMEWLETEAKMETMRKIINR